MASLDKGFLSENRTKDDVIVLDYAELSRRSSVCKALGLRVVATSGSFDVKHIGHDRYLMKARQLGDVLFVGVDSDDKIKRRKGPNRPVVEQDERLEQIFHLRWVNVVTLKNVTDERHAFLKAVLPDVLLISTQTKKGEQVPEYSAEEILEFKKYCGEVKVCEPQASTSTTARIRTLILDFKEYMRTTLTQEFPGFIDRIADDFFKPKKGE